MIRTLVAAVRAALFVVWLAIGAAIAGTRAAWNRWLAGARRPRRRLRRLRKRRPIHSTRADAKRKAHAYAKAVTGRDISWKSARKLLARWGRESKAMKAAS